MFDIIFASFKEESALSRFSGNIENAKKEIGYLKERYDFFKGKSLKLDMSRGKPSEEQLEISTAMLDILKNTSNCKTENGVDCRNYGLLDGIPEMKRLLAELMQVDVSQVIVGGNSSLNMMFDTFTALMTHGIDGMVPWSKQGKVKFLCPVPGYDRHFSILKYYGVEMLPVKMTPQGPDMDEVERLVQSDESVKGIWCVPKYSNPQGITYSDETVRRFARLKPAAKDFRIFWDNAYAIHDVTDTPDSLLSIMQECKKENSEDRVIIFCSTSKITFPGAGVAAMAASEKNLEVFRHRYSFQTIGFDKLNQLRHVYFFKDYQGMLKHMQKHKEILRPKFQAVLEILEKELGGTELASWNSPNGGYFVSVDVLPGCAKRVVSLCREAGVIFTPAGATYPNGQDPLDSNIRIAPTYPPVSELRTAMELFCICVKLAAAEKLLQNI